MTNILADTIPGIRVVKAFSQEAREIRRFEAANQRIVDVNNRALIIHPLARLHAKSHYAVAIRNTSGIALHAHTYVIDTDLGAWRDHIADQLGSALTGESPTTTDAMTAAPSASATTCSTSRRSRSRPRASTSLMTG